jgi:hypothetical protein
MFHGSRNLKYKGLIFLIYLPTFSIIQCVLGGIVNIVAGGSIDYSQ